MPNPTTRVLAVLELLQTHGQLSGSELARRLEVDGRTLRRYIATLEEMGIPLTAERGRHGGYRLVAGFKLPPMMFTNEETLALSLGLLAAQNLGLEQAAPAVASARACAPWATPPPWTCPDHGRPRANAGCWTWPPPCRRVNGCTSSTAPATAATASARPIPTAWSIAPGAGT